MADALVWFVGTLCGIACMLYLFEDRIMSVLYSHNRILKCPRNVRENWTIENRISGFSYIPEELTPLDNKGTRVKIVATSVDPPYNRITLDDVTDDVLKHSAIDGMRTGKVRYWLADEALKGLVEMSGSHPGATEPNTAHPRYTTEEIRRKEANMHMEIMRLESENRNLKANLRQDVGDLVNNAAQLAGSTKRDYPKK